MDPRPFGKIEHSPQVERASNGPVRRALRLAAGVLRELANAGGLPLERLLAAAAEAVSMERAFLVRETEGRGPKLEAWYSGRADGSCRPSRTVALRALASERMLVSLDVGRDARFAEGASVRNLELRELMAAPLPPSGDTARAALLLDNRGRARPRGAGLPRTAETAADCLEPFAALAAVLLGGPARSSPVHRHERVASAASLAGDEPALVGRSPRFRRMLEWARRVAGCPYPAVIVGETGSGKEGVARLLHRLGPGRQGPFVALNCASMPETLLESELFGAVRGAYTGADRDRPGLFRLASGGTLLLDEIGDMPGPMQAKLLRALEQRRIRPVGGDEEFAVDARVVAATHRDLVERVRAGRFRADLYHRVALLEIRVPALRERASDLPLLVAHLVRRLAHEGGLPPIRLAPCALERLRAHPWPGNVRELRAVLLRAMLRVDGGLVTADRLDLPTRETATGSADHDGLETNMIAEALRASGGNVARAARGIGWSRQKLYRRMAALGIPRPPR